MRLLLAVWSVCALGLPSRDAQAQNRHVDTRQVDARHALDSRTNPPVAPLQGGVRGPDVEELKESSISRKSASEWSRPTGAAGPQVFENREYPTVDVTGVFQLDAAWFAQDQLNRRALGDVQDGIGFRRARVAARGDVAANTSYILEIDFAASQPRFVDVWVDFSGVPHLGNLRLGRWRQPFGMAELTSIRELPFLERPLTFALAPFRQTGIGFYDHNAQRDITWAVSGVRFASDNFGNTIGDNGGYGVVGRTTVLPYIENGGERLLHLGFGYSFLDPADDAVRFASIPEVEAGESLGGLLQAPFRGVPAFVNTGIVPTDNLSLFGLEAAAAIGRLYLQSEFRWAVVNRPGGDTDTLPGAYAQARYVLTGEKLPYNRTTGVFGRIVPDQDFNFHSGTGAWELTARWSFLDLNGRGFPGPGRRVVNLTFGVNWYLNQFTKFQLNYIHAFLDDLVLGDSDADVLALRTQLDF